MRTGQSGQWQPCVSLLLCAVVGWIFLTDLGPSEFSGGSITGRLLALHDVSGYLFVLGAAVTFIDRRIASVLAIVASCLAMPLYLYFIAPGVFRHFTTGEYSVPLQANFVWNTWAIAAMALVVTAGALCVRRFASDAR